MERDVHVEDAAGLNFQDHKYVDQFKRCGDGNEEVAGDDCLGMIPNERHPALLRISRARVGRFGM